MIPISDDPTALVFGQLHEAGPKAKMKAENLLLLATWHDSIERSESPNPEIGVERRCSKGCLVRIKGNLHLGSMRRRQAHGSDARQVGFANSLQSSFGVIRNDDPLISEDIPSQVDEPERPVQRMERASDIWSLFEVFEDVDEARWRLQQWIDRLVRWSGLDILDNLVPSFFGSLGLRIWGEISSHQPNGFIPLHVTD